MKRPHYVALGLVVVLTLTILNLPAGATTRLKLGLSSLFLPLFGLTGAVQQSLGGAGDVLTSRSELLRQNEALRRENQELRRQTQDYNTLFAENDRLRAQVGWKARQRDATRYKLAKVVIRDPANWWRTVQINLGSRDGIRTNQTVVTSEGLVGRIESVALTRSQVVLLGDPACKVSARVDSPGANSRGRDTGIIGASGPLQVDYVELSNLSPNADLKPGQIVRTSGIGGVFPEDIVIGTILDLRTAEYGLYQVARVKLAAKLNALDEVWVITGP